MCATWQTSGIKERLICDDGENRRHYMICSLGKNTHFSKANLCVITRDSTQMWLPSEECSAMELQPELLGGAISFRVASPSRLPMEVTANGLSPCAMVVAGSNALEHHHGAGPRPRRGLFLLHGKRPVMCVVTYPVSMVKHNTISNHEQNQARGRFIRFCRFEGLK